MIRTKKIACLLVGAALGLGMLTGCGSSEDGSDGPKDKIVIGVGGPQGISAWAQHLAARGQGLFDDLDVDVEFQEIDASTSVSSLTSGNIDFLIGGVPTFAAARAEGIDMKAVALLSTGQNLALVASTKQRDRRGTELTAFDDAVWGISSPGSGSNVVAQDAAERAGLEWDDLKTIAFGKMPAALAALEAGRLDIASIDVGTAGVAVTDDIGYVVYNSNTDAPEVVVGTILTTTTKLAESQPDLVQAVVDAYLGGVSAVRENVDSADSVLGLFPAEYQEKMKAAFPEAWKLTAPGFGGDGRFPADVVSNTVDYLRNAGYLEDEAGADLVVKGFDNEFVEASHAGASKP